MLLSAKVYLVYSRMGPQKDPLYSIDKLFIRMDSWWMSKKQVSKYIVYTVEVQVLMQLLVCLRRLEMAMKVRQRAVVTASRV